MELQNQHFSKRIWGGGEVGRGCERNKGGGGGAGGGSPVLDRSSTTSSMRSWDPRKTHLATHCSAQSPRSWPKLRMHANRPFSLRPATHFASISQPLSILNTEEPHAVRSWHSVGFSNLSAAIGFCVAPRFCCLNDAFSHSQDHNERKLFGSQHPARPLFAWRLASGCHAERRSGHLSLPLQRHASHAGRLFHRQRTPWHPPSYRRCVVLPQLLLPVLPPFGPPRIARQLCWYRKRQQRRP